MADAGWVAVVRVAQRQLGMVSLQQVRAAGLSRAALRWRLSAGQLEPVHQRVYRLPGGPRTWEASALAALLLVGPAGALSHQSAAWLWRLDGQSRPPGSLDVTVPLTSRVRGALGLQVHRSRVAFKTVALGALRVTSLARTLLDLAGGLRAAHRRDDPLEDALDSAQRLHPGTAAQVDRALSSLGNGRNGTGRLRLLLDQRSGAGTDSRLEARVARALREAGLPRPKHQHQVFDARGYVLRVDFAWLAEQVALHVDGYAYHQQRSRFERDREAASRLAALGWHSLWVTHRSLEGASWLASLRTSLASRAAQQALL